MFFKSLVNALTYFQNFKTKKERRKKEWCFYQGTSGPLSWELPREQAGEGNGTPLQYSCLENPMDGRVCSSWGRGESDMTERLHFHFHALEKAMATHSSVLAWRTPGMGEPGGLPSVGLHRVEHDWSDSAAAAAREKAREQELTCRFTKVEGKHYWPVYGWLQWPEGGLSVRKETHTVSVESSQEKLG